MNINFSKLKNLFTKKSKSFKKPIVSPFRDWKIILIFFLIINVVTISFGIRKFYNIEYGGIIYPGDITESILTIDRGTMDDVLNYYEKQDALFDIMKIEGVSTVDPSR